VLLSDRCDHIQVTLITAGAVCCAISLFSGLWLRQAPEGYVPVNFDPSKVKKALDTNLESYTISRALKTRQFWFIFICMTFFPALYLVMFSRFSVFMTDRGISLAYATLGVSVYNIANVVGRFGLGALIDKIGYKRSTLSAGPAAFCPRSAC
jgi:cyanate permease